MSTRKRRYRPDVPVDLTSDEEESDHSATDEEQTKKIQVKVVKRGDSKNKEEGVTMKVEIDIPLRWVMIWYCQKSGLDYQTTRFEFNGAKLRETDTPFQVGMVNDDVIFAVSIDDNSGGSGHRDEHYVTLCIRMHKEKESFLRVRRSTAILPQLIRCFSESDEPQEQGSLCFVYGGLKLAENHTADQLNMEDGDIIDGFNFKTMSSSLSMIPRHIHIKVQCSSGNVTQFRVTQNTRISQIMNKLASSDSKLEVGRFFFIYKGRRMYSNNTVGEHRLVDGDTIDSLICQTGC